jgi:hypothetical protein
MEFMGYIEKVRMPRGLKQKSFSPANKGSGFEEGRLVEESPCDGGQPLESPGISWRQGPCSGFEV